MKSVALALALLLAVGSHAASLQADDPSTRDAVRSYVLNYVEDGKEAAKRALSRLDGTVYEGHKAQLIEGIDQVYQQLVEYQRVAATYTDAALDQADQITANTRAEIRGDFDTLLNEIAGQREKLGQTIQEHIAQYRTKVDEMMTDSTPDIQALTAKLQPQVEAFREMVRTNVEETKTAAMPILDALRTKVINRLENLKAMATPYVDDYKDQLKLMYGSAKDTAAGMNTDDLKASIVSGVEELKTKFLTFIETLKS